MSTELTTTKNTSDKPSFTKKLLASLAVFGMLATMMPTESYARGGHGHGYYGGGHGYYGGGYRHGYRSGYRHGHRQYRHRHRSSGAWIPFAVLGTAALTYAITSNNNRRYDNRYDRRYDNRYDRNYGDAREYSATKPCHIAYRDEDHGGEIVRMAATMCYDQSGVAYIVRGSEHQVPMD